jgi:hypothetical protein
MTIRDIAKKLTNVADSFSENIQVEVTIITDDEDIANSIKQSSLSDKRQEIKKTFSTDK